MDKELTLEEFLDKLNNDAIPLQERIISLLDKLLELTKNEHTDTNLANMKLLERHIQVVRNKIKEVELQMGIK